METFRLENNMRIVKVYILHILYTDIVPELFYMNAEHILFPIFEVVVRQWDACHFFPFSFFHDDTDWSHSLRGYSPVINVGIFVCKGMTQQNFLEHYRTKQRQKSAKSLPNIEILCNMNEWKWKWNFKEKKRIDETLTIRMEYVMYDDETD